MLNRLCRKRFAVAMILCLSMVFFRAIGSCVCRHCGGFGTELGMESVFED